MKSLIGITRRADLVFHRSGQIDISLRAALMLNMHPGDVIDIVSLNGEYYLYVHLHAPVVGRHIGKVCYSKRGTQHLRTYAQRLCRTMFTLCPTTTTTVRLCVGEKVYIPGLGVALTIITKMPVP